MRRMCRLILTKGISIVQNSYNIDMKEQHRWQGSFWLNMSTQIRALILARVLQFSEFIPKFNGRCAYGDFVNLEDLLVQSLRDTRRGGLHTCIYRISTRACIEIKVFTQLVLQVTCKYELDIDSLFIYGKMHQQVCIWIISLRKKKTFGLYLVTVYIKCFLNNSYKGQSHKNLKYDTIGQTFNSSARKNETLRHML